MSIESHKFGKFMVAGRGAEDSARACPFPATEQTFGLGARKFIRLGKEVAPFFHPERDRYLAEMALDNVGVDELARRTGARATGGYAFDIPAWIP